MNKFYEFDIIPTILKKFKISRIIISGLSDENLIKEILKYDAKIIAINSKISEPEEIIDDYVLDVLPKLKNYDAIFIDDDPNWYTVYNELQHIKKTNEEFPLVFICNNRFPHKFRDSYSNPDNIPLEYKHEYLDKLPLFYKNKEFYISDGLYHACDEKTPKNGVLTAINDFLVEYTCIGVMKINFVEDITILYPKSTISKIRIDKIFDKIAGNEIQNIEFSDKLLENQMLCTYIAKNNINNELDANFSLKSSEGNEIDHIHHMELEYKNSQIESFKNELNLKNAQIKKFEYSAINKENEIEKLHEKLENATKQVNSLKNKLDAEENHSKNEIMSLQNKLEGTKNQVNYLRNELETKENTFLIRESTLYEQLNKSLEKLNKQNRNIDTKNKQLKTKEEQLRHNETKLNSINSKYSKQLSEIDNKEYCITCFKEELSNKNLEIEYLKKGRFAKKILSPLSYLYLIFKSNPEELKINLKLFKILKNSKCFDAGFYLNNYTDIQNSVWFNYLPLELHYICHGFSEKREFNKKYFNKNSKKELLEYLLICGEL